MKPPNFKYFAVRSVEEAVELLAEHGDEARVLAGGQSLVQEMNARRVRPRVLIDVNSVSGLDYVAEENGSLELGAMTRTVAVEGDTAVVRRAPVLAEAASRVGHVAVRNRGTVGGNLAHADPAANLPPVMLALDATITARSRVGEREIPAMDFFRGPCLTTLAPEEILTGIRLPTPPEGSGSAFLEVSRRGRGWGIGGVAAIVSLSGGEISDARICLSGMGPTALRASGAEESLRGEVASAESFSEAAGIAAGEIDPPEDANASAGYRRRLASVLVRRALAVAAARAERSE